MVSLRCKLLVKRELERLDVPYHSVELGVINTVDKVSTKKLNELKENLLPSGLEIIEDHKSILIERIKVVIIEMVHYTDVLPTVNYSDYITEKLNLDYTYLSNIFSEVMGVTIQHFIIMHKIERVKELLLYNQLNLSEISYKLNYSSVAHLSSQFKKVTGLTPSHYRKLKIRRVNTLENIVEEGKGYPQDASESEDQ